MEAGMMRVDMQVHEEYKDGRVKNYTDSVFFHELKVLTEAQRKARFSAMGLAVRTVSLTFNAESS